MTPFPASKREGRFMSQLQLNAINKVEDMISHITFNIDNLTQGHADFCSLDLINFKIFMFLSELNT